MEMIEIVRLTLPLILVSGACLHFGLKKKEGPEY